MFGTQGMHGCAESGSIRDEAQKQTIHKWKIGAYRFLENTSAIRKRCLVENPSLIWLKEFEELTGAGW
jgi:hypothetical protein